MNRLGRRIFAALGMALRAAILLAGYWFFSYNYARGHVCADMGTFAMQSLAYGILSLLWIFKNPCRDFLAKHVRANWPRYCLYVLVPIVSFYIIEICYNPQWQSMKLIKVAINCLLIGCIYAGLSLILSGGLRAGKLILWAAWIFGLVNYYVLQFKGHPLMPTELLAWQTALTVAGDYSYWLTDSLVRATLLFLLMLCLLGVMPSGRKKAQKAVKIRACIAAGGGLMFLWLSLAVFFKIPWIDIKFINVDEMNRGTDGLFGWFTTDSLYFKNGAAFSFLLQEQMTVVKAPETYKKADAQACLAESDEEKKLDVQPTVIAIMNETFSDLNVLGNFSSDEYLANWRQMDDYVYQGLSYCSTIGGGTHRSEFEFLTGNSLFNLPASVTPYMMYSMDNVENMASTLKKYGYEAVAFHPEKARNWNRKQAYAALGFDRFISKESLSNIETLRGNATDRYCFNQIISLYENRTGPLFVFNVTMQNHSGYGALDTVKSLTPVYLEERYRQYEEAETYLTLIRESDAAFKEFLDYFRQVEDPVIICMFGDHQPNFGSRFINEIWDSSDPSIANQEKRYAVPYVIWSNFDVGVEGVEKDTSLNYLGAELLHLIGVTTPYTQMLLDMEKEIPIINQCGYQTADGVWHSSGEENDWIRQYANLQYYQMFDK